MTNEEINAKRDQLEHDLAELEESVATALLNARRQHAKIDQIESSLAEIMTQVQGNTSDFEHLEHRLRSIRVGIMGLYDAKEAQSTGAAE